MAVVMVLLLVLLMLQLLFHATGMITCVDIYIKDATKRLGRVVPSQICLLLDQNQPFFAQ